MPGRAVPLPTPYQLHWDILAAYQARFQCGDAAALVVSSGDVRAIDPDLSDQQVREALRILVTDPEVMADLLANHLPQVIDQARQENPAG